MTVADASAVHALVEMHAVYRMLDREGRVLYIGVTGHVGQRFGDHAMKRWFPLVATITLEWYPDKDAAVQAEREAILAERPPYNSQIFSVNPNHPRIWRKPAPHGSAGSELTSSQRSALIELLADDGTTIKRAAAALGISAWCARQRLGRLRDVGLAEITGDGRGARWRLTDAARSDDLRR